MTMTELLKRAGLTEDYLRHPPEGGRNIAGILRIAEVLDVNPAELMGLEMSSPERRSMTMIAHVMAHVHLTIMRANGHGGAPTDVEKIILAVMTALKEQDAPVPKSRPKAAGAAKTRRSA